MDIGSYRDLHRHRMMTQERQTFSTFHGHRVPLELQQCGLDSRFEEALERADRQVAWMHRDRHQTCPCRVAVLRVRALRAHEKPAVGLQGGHDFTCGHALQIIRFTLCRVKALNSSTLSIIAFMRHVC